VNPPTPLVKGRGDFRTGEKKKKKNKSAKNQTVRKSKKKNTWVMKKRGKGPGGYFSKGTKALYAENC